MKVEPMVEPAAHPIRSITWLVLGRYTPSIAAQTVIFTATIAVGALEMGKG